MASLDPDWTFRPSPDAPPLGLSAVFSIGGDIIYLFSKAYSPAATCATALPRPVQDLLLFEPVVPLRWTESGFQALHECEWQDMSAAKDTYVGINTASSAHTNTEEPPEHDFADVDISSSTSDEDIESEPSSVDGDAAHDSCSVQSASDKASLIDA